MTGETRVQFHNDQIHLLVSHESQISVYDSKLECVRSWSPKEALCAPISSAIYSCDGTLVYAGFGDGAVGVFDADSLRLRCRIAPSSYIPPSTSSAMINIFNKIYGKQQNCVDIHFGQGDLIMLISDLDQSGSKSKYFL